MSLYTCEAQQKVRKQCESQSPTQVFIVRFAKGIFPANWAVELDKNDDCLKE